jgi:hypothetical protein
MDQSLPAFILECEFTEPAVSAPRSCRLLTRISAPDRDDYWLAQVSPPFPGRYFGEDNVISKVIIATKAEGQTLFDRHRAYIPVYIARILDEAVITECKMVPNQLEVMLWCLARPASNVVVSP